MTENQCVVKKVEKKGKKRCGKVWQERQKAVPLQPQKRNRPVVVKLWRDAGGRRTGADAGFLKKKLEKSSRKIWRLEIKAVPL